MFASPADEPQAAFGDVAVGERAQVELGSAIGGEMRSAARFGLLIRPAKLICDGFEMPCVMRDVSETGVSIKLFHPVSDRATFELETLSGDRFAMSLVWQNGLSAGFQFTGAIDVSRILSNAGPYPNRPVRLEMEFPATLEYGGVRTHATVTNISQQGARLICADRLAIAQLVALEAQGLPRIRAKVRWRRDDQYGLVFEDTFTLAELSEVAMRIRAANAQLRRASKPSAA